MDTDFVTGNSTQCIGDCRNIGRDHTRIRIQTTITGEKVFVLSDERHQIMGTYLFLTLKNEFYIGSRSTAVNYGLYRFYGGHDLSLHIRCAPCKEIIAALCRLEGSAFPEIKGIRGLYIVVSVD
ncbi:hypothetical protein ES703_104349 [subsurface metagenome]